MELPQTPSFRLEGRRALVVARGAQSLNSAVDAVLDKGYSAESLIMDISNVDSITGSLQAQSAFDVVVNSAGTANHKPALETTAEDYKGVMEFTVHQNMLWKAWLKPWRLNGDRKIFVLILSARPL